MRSILRVSWMILLLAGLAPAALPADHPFVGSKKCKMCHLKEWTSWSATKMAKTFDVLKPGERAEQKKAAGLDPAKDYTKDPTCLPCHVTGCGAEGGFKDIETTPDLAGVGCEMCHGAGSTYIKPEYMSLKNKEYKKAEIVAAGMVAEVGGAQCVGCHNDKSPFFKEGQAFDFKAEKSKGMHEVVPLKYTH